MIETFNEHRGTFEKKLFIKRNKLNYFLISVIILVLVSMAFVFISHSSSDSSITSANDIEKISDKNLIEKEKTFFGRIFEKIGNIFSKNQEDKAILNESVKTEDNFSDAIPLIVNNTKDLVLNATGNNKSGSSSGGGSSGSGGGGSGGGGSSSTPKVPAVNITPGLSINTVTGGWLDLPQEAILKGIADGNSLTYTWSKVSGPGTVIFATKNSKDTTAAISSPGTYVLRLSANNGSATMNEHTTIQVHDSGSLSMQIEYTEIPKATANWSNFVNIYTLNLSGYGIYNDGTHPVETSAGINLALQYAKTIDVNRIVFPSGVYLISELESIIFNHKDTIIDFNGATLKMNPNGLETVNMVVLDRGAENIRLTNGIFLGDKATHDYTTVPGSHEWARAIYFESGYNVEFDNMTVRDFTGFAISLTSGIKDVSESFQYLYQYNTNIESGAFNSAGNKIVDPTKIRSNVAYSLAKFDEFEFEFGMSGGYQGYYMITERTYQVYFYDENMNFIEKKDAIQYRKLSFNPSAKFVQFEFNQPDIWYDSPNFYPYVGRMTDMEPIEHLHLHDNWIYRNRGLGLAVVGGQKLIIENNLFEENGYESDEITLGASPAMAVDFEDGWDLMQDIIFRKNIFRNNRADLTVVAGTEMIFEENKLEKGIRFMVRSGNYVWRNNSLKAVADRGDGNPGGFVSFGTNIGLRHFTENPVSNRLVTGTSIHNNHYENIGQFMFQDSVATPIIKLENEVILGIKTGTSYNYNFFNTTFVDARFLASGITESFKCVSCTFQGDSYIQFYKAGPSFVVENINPTGTLSQNGPWINRSL